MAVATRLFILLFDQPTTGLSPRHVTLLSDNLREPAD